MPKKGGFQECPNCGVCKESFEHVFFEHAIVPRDEIAWTI